jgi:hypothetical protein
MYELLSCLVVGVVAIFVFVVCCSIISCCRDNNDECDQRRPILVSSSRNVSYTQGFYAPVNSTPTIPSYNDRLLGHSRPFQASSSHNIPDTRDFYVPTNSAVKTLTIPQHGRNVSSTGCIIAPPREGPSLVTALSNILLSEEGENVTDEEGLREKAQRMMRGMHEALNLAKQARKRRDFSAEVMHKQDARVLECAMERLNEEAAKAIFNQKNKVYIMANQSLRDSEAMRTELSLWCVRVSPMERWISTVCTSMKLSNTQSWNFRRSY